MVGSRHRGRAISSALSQNQAGLRRCRCGRVALLRCGQHLAALLPDQHRRHDAAAGGAGVRRRTPLRRPARSGHGGLQRPPQAALGAQGVHPLGRRAARSQLRPDVGHRHARPLAGGPVRAGAAAVHDLLAALYRGSGPLHGAHPGAGAGLRRTHRPEQLPGQLRHLPLRCWRWQPHRRSCWPCRPAPSWPRAAPRAGLFWGWCSGCSQSSPI